MIDTFTPGGKPTFPILASIAEFERDLISERTCDGLDAARARGHLGGRRPKMTPGKLATTRQLYEAREHKVAEITAVTGVSRATLPRALAARADERTVRA